MNSPAMFIYNTKIYSQPSGHAGSWLADFSTLKIEAIHSSETSVHTRCTRRHIQEDDILHSDLHENLESYICLSDRMFILLKKVSEF
jgi:hypothetical protein